MVDFPEIEQPPATKYLDESGKIVAPGIVQGAMVPTIERLPTAQEMLSMSDADLIALLQRYNIVDDWEYIVNSASRYNERMSRLNPGDPGWEGQMRELLSTESRRGLLGLNRRAAERWQTMEALDGDPSQELIRLGEGDDDMCDRCREREGAIGTYAEHTAMGLPGAASCSGGDNCRCVLVAID
jgi:hypothetical protein